MSLCNVEGIEMEIRLQPSLLLEITRRCNNKCPHCLRGAQQQKDMSEAVINLVTSRFTPDEIFFTGGEPTLAPDLIRYATMTSRAIEISMVTNGTMSRKWKETLEELLQMIDVAIDVSEDQFHPERRNDYSDFMDWKRFTYTSRGRITRILSEGNARIHGMGWDKPIDGMIEDIDYEDDVYYLTASIYVNVDGNIISGCDYSYKNQNKHIVSNVYKEYDEIVQDIATYCSNQLMACYLKNQAEKEYA